MKPNTHSFLLEDAERHGVAAACVLFHLRYLQQTKADKSHPTHEGKHWVNYTYEALANTFPYLSIQQVRRVMKKLTDDGVVVKEHLAKQRFNRELYWHIPSSEIDSSDVSKSTDIDVSKSTDVLHASNILVNIKSEFDEFWSAYPKKLGDKKAAKRKFEKLKPETQELVIANVRSRTKLDKQWQDKQFIPYPVTYLNGSRWEDEWEPTNTDSNPRKIDNDTVYF